jgi:hypothetical protein
LEKDLRAHSPAAGNHNPKKEIPAETTARMTAMTTLRTVAFPALLPARGKCHGSHPPTKASHKYFGDGLATVWRWFGDGLAMVWRWFGDVETRNEG